MYSALRLEIVIGIEKPLEQTPEDQIKLSEDRIQSLLNASYLSAATGQSQEALDKAKEAYKQEKTLSTLREQVKLAPQSQNVDLTFCVLLNLADKYHLNGLYNEAIQVYQVILKNKTFNQPGRLRVNLGNIYMELENYGMAVKMYRMALDQIPSSHSIIRWVTYLWMSFNACP